MVDRSSWTVAVGSAARDVARLGAVDDSAGCDSRGSASCSCSATCRTARRATTFRPRRARRSPTSRTSSRIGAIASSIPPGCSRHRRRGRRSPAGCKGPMNRLRGDARSHARRPFVTAGQIRDARPDGNAERRAARSGSWAGEQRWRSRRSRQFRRAEAAQNRGEIDALRQRLCESRIRDRDSTKRASLRIRFGGRR